MEAEQATHNESISSMEMSDEANSNHANRNQQQPKVANDLNGDDVEAEDNEQAHNNEQAEATEPDEVEQANNALKADYDEDKSDGPNGGNDDNGGNGSAVHGNNLFYGRLESERKAWRKDHPHGTFLRSAEGNLCRWYGGIYGRPGTPLQGGLYRFTIDLAYNYPLSPPIVQWSQQLYHPNIYHDRFVNGIDYLQPAKWTGAENFKDIVRDLKDLLHKPKVQPHYRANMDAMNAYVKNPSYYRKRMQIQAKQFQDIQ